jgi:histidine triad (HIT) family protein
VTSTDCLFCRIVAGEIPATIVHTTDRTVAFLDINPVAPVHVLVIPKDHHRDLAAAAVADPTLLADLMAAASEVAAAENLTGSGYRVVVNSGPDSGQVVFHLHAHVLGGTHLGRIATP